MGRILVIEDHKRLLRSLERGLTAAGHDVVGTESGESGFYYASTESFDVLILDIMLPGRGGLEVLRDLRRAGFSAPVLIVSARDSVADRIRGLDGGADDYLVKPFSFDELQARIRAQLNRTVPTRCMVLTAADVQLHVATHKATRNGEELHLSKSEYRLLEYLVLHKNESVSRDAILRDVWRDPQGNLGNVVDVCINSLRKKLEGPDLPKLIHTIRGVGYSLNDGSKPQISDD